MAIKISILNPKGGAGKSTLAIHLARGFQLKGKSVIIADTDEQGSALDWRAQEHESIEYPSVMGMNPSTLETDLKHLDKAVDVIIVDGAAKLTASQMVPSIKVANLVVIPLQPSGLDVWAVNDLVDIITARREATGGKPLTYFMLSKADDRTVLTRDVPEVLETMNLPVMKAKFSDREEFKKRVTDGETVFELPSSNLARQEAEAVLTEIEEIING